MFVYSCISLFTHHHYSVEPSKVQKDGHPINPTDPQYYCYLLLIGELPMARLCSVQSVSVSQMLQPGRLLVFSNTHMSQLTWSIIHAGSRLCLESNISRGVNLVWKLGGVVGPGLKTRRSLVLKVQQTEARSTGLRVSYQEFLFNTHKSCYFWNVTTLESILLSYFSRVGHCSSATSQLLVPRAKTTTRQRRAFSIVGPSTWNGLPLEIRILPKK